MTQINILEYGVKRADEFQPHPYNAKIHPVFQQTVIRALLNELGWVAPVIESKRSGYLIDGHERVFEELKTEPPGLIPYVIVDLTEAQEALALAQLDASAGLAIYDRASLEMLREKFKSGDPAIAELMRRIEADAMRVAPLTEQPDPPPAVRAGETWRLGANLIHVYFITQLPELIATGQLDAGIILEPSTAAYVFGQLRTLGHEPIRVNIRGRQGVK